MRIRRFSERKAATAGDETADENPP